MKGHQQHSSPLLLPPNKRRRTALAAAVPALVVCSILLPLVFLLGLHRPGVYSASSWVGLPDLCASLACPSNRVALHPCRLWIGGARRGRHQHRKLASSRANFTFSSPTLLHSHSRGTNQTPSSDC